MSRRYLVFSTHAYAAMARQIAVAGRWKLGDVEVRDFPDGERYQRIVTSVSDKDVVLVGGTISDQDTLELYDLACALVKYGARSLDLIIPYFGYSTMERAVKLGEVVTAKTRARLLSSIPGAARGNRVFLLDLHSDGIPHYFEGNITAFHVYGKPMVVKAARQLGGKDFVLASTDAGRAKWVQSLAEDMGVDASFVFKRRLDGKHTAVTGVSAQVKNRHVIIYDDMIRTGGSLLSAARVYQEAGAKTIDVISTHGLFPGDALEKLHQSGVIRAIHVTDSHPRALELKGGFLKVHPVASLLVEALRRHS
jgi:ribose-phosphate pyrophosphokinase